MKLRSIVVLLLGGILAAHASAEADDTPAAPAGELLRCTFAASNVYPGTTRDYTVYVPAQYDGRTPACVHVHQDGMQYGGPAVFDRLIHQGRMPVTIGVFVNPGRVPAARDGAVDRVNRSYEYDTLTGDYARFLLDELLPDVERQKATDGRPLRLSKSGNDRAIAGHSSGGICSFTAAWERPDGFSRVFSSIGSFTGLRGGHAYATLVRKTEPKPVRVFLQEGRNDLSNYAGDWWLANEMLERSLTFAGYEVRHAWGDGGHDAKQALEVFPDAVAWLWEGWPKPVGRGAGSPQLREILHPDEPWRLVGEGYRFTEGPAVNRTGDVFFNDVGAGRTYRITPDRKAEVWLEDSRRGDGQAFAPDGRLVAASAADEALLAWGDDRRSATIVQGWRGNDLVVSVTGDIYVTEPGWDGTKPSRIHHVSPAGVDTVVDTGLRFANGLCLSPDQTTLFVADSRSRWVWSYTLRGDGGLTNKQRFIQLHVPDNADDSGADGMRCDRDGRLWVATRMGIQVCDQQGRVTCIIPTPNGRVSNLCFGGAEFDTLIATCGDKVYARRVLARGAPSFLPPVTPHTPR